VARSSNEGWRWARGVRASSQALRSVDVAWPMRARKWRSSGLGRSDGEYRKLGTAHRHLRTQIPDPRTVKMEQLGSSGSLRLFKRRSRDGLPAGIPGRGLGLRRKVPRCGTYRRNCSDRHFAVGSAVPGCRAPPSTWRASHRRHDSVTLAADQETRSGRSPAPTGPARPGAVQCCGLGLSRPRDDEPSRAAALLNGTAATPSTTTTSRQHERHPSAVLVPTALAVGKKSAPPDIRSRCYCTGFQIECAWPTA